MAQTIDLKEVQKHLNTDASPHIRVPRTVSWVMDQVLISLIPVIIAATFFFGWWVLVQLLITNVTAVLTEYIWQRSTNQDVTIKDHSALVTGTLLGLSFPVITPIWLLIVSSIFAIAVVKQWNGGLGRNYLNPAVTARVTAKILFTPFFARWVLPGGFFAGFRGGADAITTATPLEYLGHGATRVASQVPSLWNLFIGTNLGGNIGETSKLAILLGFIYLIARRVINPKIPILFVGSAFAVAILWSGFNVYYATAHILSGTLMFGAVFMATDYSSGALTPTGKTIFAICGGVLTMLIRIIFNYPGGFGIALIIMNIFAPYIDSKVMPRIYGHSKRPKVWLDRQSLMKPKSIK